MAQQREAIVYLLRDTKTLLPFYIGSTIRPNQRKCDHITLKELKHDRTIQSYVRSNHIDYTHEVLERIFGTRSEVLIKIRKMEQKYILKCKHPLINKRNPLSFISKINKKYPWLSNKTLNKTIII